MTLLKNAFLLTLFFVIFIAGCQNNSPSESTFIPPKDKIVTKDMATRYAIVSVALTEAVEEEAGIIEDFRGKYNISLDMNELNDRGFKKAHPEVISEWGRIQEEWQEKQVSIYEKYGMSEKEWDWIAGALIMPRNKPMQEFIREEIERIGKEESQKGIQTTGNK